MKREFTIIFLAILTALAVSCTSGPESSASPPPTPPEFVEDLKPKGPVVAKIGDEVVVEVTVFAARHLVLDEKNPVEIYTPADSPFQFTEKIYRIDPKTRQFPVRVEFRIGDQTEFKAYSLKLAMRVFFRNKADNAPQVRNVVFEAPLNVVSQSSDMEKKHFYPMEYMLE